MKKELPLILLLLTSISSFAQWLPWKDITLQKYGFINENQEVVIPAVFDSVSPFSENLAPVLLDGKWGYVDVFGNTVIAASYDSVTSFSSGYALVMDLDSLDRNFGFIDSKGNLVVGVENSKKIALAKLEVYKLSLLDYLLPQKSPNGSFGYVNGAGEWVIEPKYASAGRFYNGFACVEMGNKKGLIDAQGIIMIPTQYDLIMKSVTRHDTSFFNSDDLAIVKVNDKWGYVDMFGKEYIAPNLKYDRVFPFCENRAAVRSKRGNMGFIDTTGNEIIPLRYEKVYNFSEGFAAVKKKGKWGIVDTDGKQIIAPQYDQVFGFDEGLCIVQTNNKFGVIDKKGQLIVPLKYDHLYNYSFGYALARLGDAGNGYYGFLDKNGVEVVPVTFPKNEVYLHLVTFCMKDLKLKRDEESGKFGFVDGFGEWSVTPQFDHASAFSEELSSVKINGKRGFINIYGELIIPFRYDDTYSFSKGFAMVRMGDVNTGVYGYIDREGNEIIQVKYTKKEAEEKLQEYVSMAVEQYLTPLKNEKDKYGFVNGNDQWVVFPKYDNVDGFSGGMAHVERNGKHGYIDKTGFEIIPLEYDYLASEFSDGLVLAQKNGKYGFLNQFGKIFIDFNYEWADNFSEGLAPVQQDEKYGFIDKNNSFVISPTLVYDNVEGFHDGMAKVEKEGKVGFINRYGNEVIAPKYDGTGNFSMDLVLVRVRSILAFINKQGEVAISPELLDYADVRDFHEDMAAVQDNISSKWGFIDKSGFKVIDTKFDDARDFEGGISMVSRDGKWGYIDRYGTEIIPVVYPENKVRTLKDNFFNTDYKSFVDNYVGALIYEWEKKGEYETTKGHSDRVNEQAKNKLVSELKTEAELMYVNFSNFSHKPKVSIGAYDPDKELYSIRDLSSNRLLDLHVPVSDAPDFKSEFSTIHLKPFYGIENDSLVLKKMVFEMLDGRVFEYDATPAVK